MSQIPPYTPRDPFAAQAPAVDVQPRVSGLAVASFVVALLCCIPGVGAVAAVLGIGAIVSISRSQGRLGGRALAFVAIVLGVLGTVLWLAILIGASQIVASLQPYRSTVAAIEAGDATGARQHLTGAAAGVTDERLTAFRDEYRQKFGSFREFPQGLGGVFSAWMAVGRGWSDMESVKHVYPRQAAIPLGATFDNGPGLVIFVIDDSARTPGPPPLKNIGVAGQGTGVIWLVDPAAKPQPPP